MKTLLYASAILSSLIAGALAAPQGAAPAASRGSPFVIPPFPQPVVPPPQPIISPAVPLDVIQPVGISPAVPINPALTQGTTPQQAVADANVGNVAMTPQTTTQTTPQTANTSGATALGIPTMDNVGRPVLNQLTPQNPARPGFVTANPVTPVFLSLSGTALADSRGQPIGSVQQVVLNQSGNISIAVANISGRLVPIPWQLVGASNVPGHPGLMVNMDHAALSQAPSITLNQLPLLTQAATLDQIFRFFGLAPGSVTTASTTTAPAAFAANGSATANGATTTGGATSSTFNTPVPPP